MSLAASRPQSNLQFWRHRIDETAAAWRAMLSPRTLGLDWVAGLTVACVALPLNLALALASGAPAGVGLITAIVGGAVAALLGGSGLQVSGPAAAMVPLVFTIVERHGLGGLAVATLIAGALQVALGLGRVGRLVQAFPVSVISGFMSGIGLLILGGQLPRLLGLPAEVKSLSALTREPVLLHQIQPINVALGLLVLAGMFLLPRLHRRLPAALIGVVAVTGITVLLGLQVPVVGSVPSGVPSLQLPALRGVDLDGLLPLALAIAALGSVESLLSAVAVDTMAKRTRHSSDQELVAQGLANIASALVGGLPVTGVIVRSSVAVQSGGRTRMTSLFHAIALLLAILVGAEWVRRVPIAGLAGVLIFVGWRLVEVREGRRLWRIARFEGCIFFATMAGIVLTDFVSGILIGLGLALVNFARTQGRIDLHFSPTSERDEGLSPPHDDALPTGVLRVEGPICFASHTALESAVIGGTLPPRLVFDLAGVPNIDVTGLQTFRDLIHSLYDRGTRVAVARARPQVVSALEAGGVTAIVHAERVFATVAESLVTPADLASTRADKRPKQQGEPS